MNDLTKALVVGLILVLAAVVVIQANQQTQLDSVIQLATSILGFGTAVIGGVRTAMGVTGFSTLSSTETAGAAAAGIIGAILLVAAHTL